VKLPSSGLDDKTVDVFLNDLKKAYSYVQKHEDLLSKVDGVKQILDAVGKVSAYMSFRTCSSHVTSTCSQIHPYASAAVTVLTIPYKVRIVFFFMSCIPIFNSFGGTNRNMSGVYVISRMLWRLY
jgi:hypothetical protein